MTWCVRASRASTCASATAVAPPTPASTSSNTSVSVSSASPSTTLHASITREISPPEAIFLSGRALIDAAGLYISSTRLGPVAVHSARGRRSCATSTAAVPISRHAICSHMAAERSGAAFARAASRASAHRASSPSARSQASLALRTTSSPFSAAETTSAASSRRASTSSMRGPNARKRPFSALMRSCISARRSPSKSIESA